MELVCCVLALIKMRGYTPGQRIACCGLACFRVKSGCDVSTHVGAINLRLEPIYYRADVRKDKSNAGVKDLLRPVCESYVLIVGREFPSLAGER
jgi:hypothetical protein